MDKLESIIALGIIILILAVFFAINISTDDIQLRNNVDRNIDRSISTDDVTGTFVVKNDKNSKLVLNEDGTYSLNINICEGYLELEGVYELRDKNLYLINRTSYEDYPNLYDNEEFHFTLLDDNSVRLEEDLVCLFRETVFEK